MTSEEAIEGIGQVSDFLARTKGGWVGAVATIFAGAAKTALGLLKSGKDPEEIRALIEDLIDNPPGRIDFANTIEKLDKIKEDRQKSPPKLP